MKKFVTLLSIFAVLLISVVGCSSETTTDEKDNGKAPEEQETFAFAMSGLYKPFNFKDESGNLVGFDVEIGKELAKRMGMKAEPVTNPWDTILVGLSSGKYDAIIGSMAITAEREENADFSRPYYRSGAQVFVAADNSEIKTTEDIRDKNIGVVKNSTYGKQALGFTDEDNLYEYDSDLTALQDLGTGRLDAVITDQMVGFRVMKEGTIDIKDVGEPLSMDEMGIPVKEGNKELLDKVNKALEEMIADGTYEEISSKWFGRSILGEDMAVQEPKEQETFTFAMSGLYKPFNFTDKDGNLVGFDVEIGKELAKRMGMKAEPVTNPWDTILVGLKSGKYDAIIGSMAITAEREENADFSRPYYRSGAQVFVAADNEEIKAADDIKDKNIGVVKNSTYGKQALEYTDEDNLYEYDSDLTALQDLKTGRLDAVITDQMVGFRVMKEGTLDIKDVGESLSMDEMGIPVNEGNKELLDKINAALEEMIADGTYEEISSKWFGRSILGE